MKNLKLFIIYYSIHDVIKSEKILLEKKILVDLVPVPRQISSDCGMAIEVEKVDVEKVKKILKENNIFFKGVFNELFEAV